MNYRISFPEKGILRILIAAIVWMTLGGLVNFHMNRIFGEQLIPQALYCKREKAKQFNLTGEFDGKSVPSAFFDVVDCGREVSQLVVYRCSEKVFWKDLILFPTRRVPSLHGLRAPPAV